MKMLPEKQQLEELLCEHVQDTYQRHHALMVATAMVGYARLFDEDEDLWYATGYLHDLDFDEYPEKHPAVSLEWFRTWSYPEELIHAVEAHALSYNGFTTEPETQLAAALIACDEICGIFYAYSKVNPVPYGEMKAKSIKKRLRETAFAPKISRDDIVYGCEKLGVTLEDHVTNLIGFFKAAEEELKATQ